MKANLFILSLMLMVLMGCGTSKDVVDIQKIQSRSIPQGVMTPIQMVGKKAALTESETHAWPHADIYSDSLPGMSLDKAYDFLQGKKPKKIKVGIIDSGIDIEHEDLKDLVWTNSVDLAGNGMDEDGNGYTDDSHGWNFLGGEKGEPVYARYSITRLLSKLSPRFEGKELAQIPFDEREEYQRYLELKKEFDTGKAGFVAQYNQFSGVLKAFKQGDEMIRKALGKDTYTLEEVQQLPAEQQHPAIVNLLKQGTDIPTTIAQFEHLVPVLQTMVEKKYNMDYRGRKTNDDPDDITDGPYGNPWVIGDRQSEEHGTHVAGIMLANRSNGKGVKGVVNSVELIAVRATPQGDEYDKDVALAIRYLTDRGVKVINMSFGKAYSEHSDWVYDAIKYAESKDVLLIKAAGNDGTDIDVKPYFPNDAPDNRIESTDNMVMVGALNPYFDERLVGDYSNYGKVNVDIFAPGTDIYSSIPNNGYGMKQGTSMASPAVAGVAALVRSYYPELSAKQVKHILINSGLLVDMEVLVPKSEGKKRMNFQEMSNSGRILNAYEAVKMADRVVKGK